MELTTKVCSKCKVEKDLTEFGKNRSKKDCLQDYCKLCGRDYQLNFHKNNIGKQSAYDDKRRKKYPDKYRQKSNLYKKNNPEKIKIYYKNNSKKINDRARERTKNIDDRYVINVLRLKKDKAPPELIELKRVQLQLTREIRNQIHGNN